MPDQPLQPFGPPTALFEKLHFSGTVSPAAAVEWALYLVFLFWALYTIVAVYHWIKYSHGSFVALPAIALHIFISFSLMTYALSGSLFL